MNIQAYIASGILEEYVLGTVSPQEKQEVECMSHIYPEIKQELMRTESALEEYALLHQTTPPASLKESIFSQMNFDEPVDFDENEEVNAKIIALGKQPEGTIVSPLAEESNVVSLVGNQPTWPKLAVAAAILLGMFAGYNAMQLSNLKKVNSELALKVETVNKDLEYNAVLANLYRNPSYKVIHMEGLEKSPQSAVAAFWNVKTNEVLLDVQNLPDAPNGKQYQLWSIVDGVPVDIGMLDDAFNGKVLKMKDTKTGSVAFAITLEKEGGSPTPTMDDMFVMGKVS